MLTQFAADWFHPNDRGHRVWADAFWARISTDAERF
jgi:lysophospholipase L1-like esterase